MPDATGEKETWSDCPDCKAPLPSCCPDPYSVKSWQHYSINLFPDANQERSMDREPRKDPHARFARVARLPVWQFAQEANLTPGAATMRPTQTPIRTRANDLNAP